MAAVQAYKAKGQTAPGLSGGHLGACVQRWSEERAAPGEVGLSRVTQGHLVLVASGSDGGAAEPAEWSNQWE